jgi:hypothetical protein
MCETMPSHHDRDGGRAATVAVAMLRVAGVAASGATTGFPVVWAKNIKKATLRQLGTGVFQSQLGGSANLRPEPEYRIIRRTERDHLLE